MVQHHINPFLICIANLLLLEVFLHCIQMLKCWQKQQEAFIFPLETEDSNFYSS